MPVKTIKEMHYPFYRNRLSYKFAIVIFLVNVFFCISTSFANEDELLEAKCGRCHSMSTSQDISRFHDTLREYNWNNWSSVPLRVWLSSHHKPRIPSINLSETESKKLLDYFNQLSSGDANSRVEGESDAVDRFFASPGAIDSANQQEILNSNNEKVEELEQEEVNFSDCLNCLD